MVSYVIANFTSYFILIMLLVCRPIANSKQFSSQWTLLVYIPYIWLFFAKLYHNEIVRYFKNLENINNNNLRIDKIIFWLNMIIYSSFFCFIFCVKEYLKTRNDLSNNTYNISINSLWIVHSVCSLCMFVNSMLCLGKFAPVRKKKYNCCITKCLQC